MQNSCFRICAPRMAPTVCIAEFPMATGTTVSSRVRYRRESQSGMKRRRFALEEMLRTGTIVETLLPPYENCELRRLDCLDTISDCSVVDRSAGYATNVDEDYKRLVAERRRGKKIAKNSKLRDVIYISYLSTTLDGYFKIFSNPRDLTTKQLLLNIFLGPVSQISSRLILN